MEHRLKEVRVERIISGNRAVAVLVIACPRAMARATPTTVLIATVSLMSSGFQPDLRRLRPGA